MATIRGLLAKYKEQCQFIREELRFRGCATSDELAEYWPGGAENRGTGIEAWIYCYASMVRFCDRIKTPEEQRDAARSSGDDDVIAALADTPETVIVSSGQRLTVYPKSFIALEVIERIDARIGWLADKRAQLMARNERVDLELLDRTVVEIGFLYGAIAWCATSGDHDGVGLPFAENEQPTVLPEDIRALSTTDLFAIRACFLQVNAIRLQALLLLLSSKKGSEPGARPSWGTFFSLREEDSHIPARTLMRDRSLASQLAATLLAADARMTATEDAKQPAA